MNCIALFQSVVLLALIMFIHMDNMVLFVCDAKRGLPGTNKESLTGNCANNPRLDAAIDSGSTRKQPGMKHDKYRYEAGRIRTHQLPRHEAGGAHGSVYGCGMEYKLSANDIT